ncbi:MAG: hypothetical protein HY699_16795 [Deltaproteobacteria bacterium]|nr:hypothetical protein [Deltaproteobacteria bacterium]
MNGAAHVTFAGGGIVLPAREPYDRQLLVEQVAERVQRKGVVRVAIHGRTWNVRRIDDNVTAACTRCRRSLHGTCYATTPGDARHCLRCAFVSSPQSSAPAPEEAALARASNGHPRGAPPRSVVAAVLRWAGFGELREIALCFTTSSDWATEDGDRRHRAPPLSSIQ